jgi:type I restriction enzyme S subunit
MIESNTGRVIEKVFESDSNLLSVAPFDEGNVLYSKLRPYLNKVVIPDSKGYATTELIPLRPNQEILNNEFLSYLLRSNEFVSYANSISSGTKMPRMPLADLRKFECILPPMDLQQRFVSFAHQADKSEFDVIKSQFIEEIGDPRTNPKNWPIKKLSELSTYTIGLTYKPEDVSEDGIIVLRSGNIQESKLTLTDTVRVNCQIKESLYVKEDDILMCSRNGSAALVGKVAQIKSVNEPMTYGAFMTIIRSEYSDYLFLYFQSNAFREQVSTGKSSTMNQITQKMLDKICLPFPDEDTRKRLSAILHQADKSESGCEYRMVS